MYEEACLSEDLKHHARLLQTTRAGVCEEKCMEAGDMPNCAQCPTFGAPDSTPGVMTWLALNDRMDTMVAWGQDS